MIHRSKHYQRLIVLRQISSDIKLINNFFDAQSPVLLVSMENQGIRHLFSLKGNCRLNCPRKLL